MKQFIQTKVPGLTEDRIFVLNHIAAANPHQIGKFECEGKHRVGDESATFPTLLFEVTDQSDRNGEAQNHKLCGLFPNEFFASAAMHGMALQHGGKNDRNFLQVQFYEGKLHSLKEYTWTDVQDDAATDRAAAA